uniref:HAMP domain-containing protein n=1 Tax=Nocardioides pantholopis TaxID=2483798 RepID=UPI0013E2CC21
MPKIRWTVGRRLAGITTIGILTTAVVAMVAWQGAGTVEDGAAQAGRHAAARGLYQSLDTRASELKATALLAAASAATPELEAALAEDAGRVQDLVAELRGLGLGERDLAEVARVETAFDEYVAGLDAVVGDAGNRRGGRSEDAAVAEVLERNRAVHEVLGVAVEDMAVATDVDSQEVLDASAGMRTLVLVTGLVGSVLLTALSFAITRSLVRPLKAAIAALQQFAAGDLTHRLPERSTGCVGDLEVAFNKSIDSVARIVASVGESAEAVAGAAEELSVGTQQIAAGAEETSV